MNRKDLVDELSQRFEGNREVAAQALDSVVDVITKSISAGERVVISGFGEFERKTRDAGEYVPEFKPGEELRDVVSGAREWRDRVTDSLAVVPVAAVEQASRAAASTMRSVAEKARELAAELSSAGDADNAGTAATAGAGQTAKKASAKKTAKKAPAKKAKKASKKAPSKKTPAGTKSTSNKSGAKKAPAKKSTATKSTATKSTAKKAPAKRIAAAKAPAAKRTAKAPAKKSAATRPTAGAKQPGI